MPPPASAAADPTSGSNLRRSFTLPARIAQRSQSSSPSTRSADGIETLFTCSFSKIVSFTASTQRQAAENLDASSSIPYRSSTERTLAVGPLRIYRVTSSNVSFLNSGNLLHTIFPRSQCWCVDGQSIFVLRIRQDSYYRIELPFDSEEDKQKVEEIKVVFAQVLQYEKTRCPFTSGSDDDRPERPITPPRPRSSRPAAKAKKWLFDKTWMPEDGSGSTTPLPEGSDSGTNATYEEEDGVSILSDRDESVTESPATPAASILPERVRLPSVRERAQQFQGSRSVTAPREYRASSLPRQAMSGSSPFVDTENVSLKEEDNLKDSVDTLSLLSSTDSFLTATQETPSPQYLDAEAELVNPWASDPLQQREPEEERGRERHRRGPSEVTVTRLSLEQVAAPASPTLIETTPSVVTPTTDAHPSSVPCTPPLINDSDEDSLELDISTPPDAIRMKRLTGASQKRAFSPMPNPHNIFKPPPNQAPSSHLTAALVRKTCELILGPPAHLVTLMLKIAARISEGAFGFKTYRIRHTTEKIPCSWESSGDEDEWEDDYGIPLRTLDHTTHKRRQFSTETD
ncbi:uncharacterized protein EI97DRAFT_504826 [Westerdykella ornata]|uniref:Inheritance of peroxisomes protein 1 n=1 Tax=Westerdykella ornata TaxID=318751 RepID=A0A6A6J7T4_WESOR|nr:uncharacterized protein EI97DRAFT_504826 [Westerdykella ornata]KAF2271686.1 hypothetical protein EI97DRAFT_504826 [Westerdykella ornata]